MQQCVFYDVMLGNIHYKNLFNASDVWDLVTTHASQARSFSYIDKSNHAQIITCIEGIKPLNNDWRNELAQAGLIYGQRFFPNSRDAKAQLLSYLPISYQYLTNISQTASQIMQQNMMAWHYNMD